jgi:hypothetical protein
LFGDAVAMSWSDFFASAGNAAPVPQTTGADKTSGGTWAELGPPPPMQGATDSYGNPLTQARVGAELTPGGTLKFTTAAADSRNVQELQARIKAAGGVLITNLNQSDYIVAINNRLKFSVTRNAAGQFEIRESSNYMYLIGAAVVIGVLLLAKK